MSHAPRQAASEHRGAGLPAPGRVLADVIEYTSDGIPYLALEIVLLFKAKHSARDKDAADLARTLPELAPERHT